MKRNVLATLALILFSGFPTPHLLATDDTVIVGILENLSPRERGIVQKDFGIDSPAIARVAFRKQSGEWRAFKSDFKDVHELGAATQDFPKQVEWTIAFSGKALGQAKSLMPASWPSYSEVGVQLLPASQNLPHQGTPSPEFQRWASDAPLYRPLVLVSQPHVIDPDQWKPIKLTSSYLKAAIPELRKKISEEDSSLKFNDHDVQVASAYGSKGGRVVFALTVREADRRSDEVPGVGRKPHSFFADAPTSVRFLGSELLYLDAGDYDGDGHSEVIFKKSGYNQDGYVLFSPDFRHSAEFFWYYH